MGDATEARACASASTDGVVAIAGPQNIPSLFPCYLVMEQGAKGILSPLGYR